jgi:N6-adenosine-specific RNA methylase IME4
MEPEKQIKVAEKIAEGAKSVVDANRLIKKEEVHETEDLEESDKKYRIIYADPPWRYNDKRDGNTTGAEDHYPTMSLDEICELPIKELAEDNAVLFLWTTSPLLEDTFQVIKAWGFKYKTSFVWDKVKHNMGHYNSVRHEFLLIATKGSCTPDNKTLYDSVQSIEKNTNHSEKPIEFMNIIDGELTNRGLTSYQQNGAEDLAIVKDSFIQKLSVQTDNDGKPIFNEKTGTLQQTAWADDYLDSDGSKTNRVVSGLSKILEDEKFMEDNKNNPTWKSVNVYFDIRKSMASELMKREVKSINAKANLDIRYAYDAVVNKLKKDDPLGFSYLYDRFLSQDLLYDKYLTPVTTEKGIE